MLRKKRERKRKKIDHTCNYVNENLIFNDDLEKLNQGSSQDKNISVCIMKNTVFLTIDTILNLANR